jgi:hypothetical protein
MAEDLTRRLKIYINGNEVDATITNLRKNLAKFRAQANQAVEGTPKWKKYNEEVARTELELKQAYKAQNDFKDSTKLAIKGLDENTKALSDFTGNLTQMFNGLKRGNFIEFQEGFKGVSTGIKSATKASLAFIATPIGIAITALAGIGIAAKAWFSYNQQVVEALKLTNSITGLTDQAADQARIRAETLAQTFDVDFKETLITAKNVAVQFGISFEEAFDVVEDQLIRGQKNNDEFFESLKEYPAFFKSAGFSASEFGKIIATGFDLGIYNDKLPDALKEADLSLKEQTKTTRDALVNAFGAPFTDDILKRVRTGETTTKDALSEIAAQADKTGINVQQNAQLTADLFKGAGEDAGGALKVFEALDIALNKQQRELTESQQITKQQVEATKELKQVSSALFSTGDKGFGLIIDKAKLFGTKVLVGILKTGIDVYNWFVDLNNESQTFSAILKTMGIVASSGFNTIGTLITLVKNQFGSLGDVIEGVFTLDYDKVKAGLKSGFGNVTEAITEIKNQAIKDAKEVQDAFNGGFKLERKTIKDFVGDETTNTNTNTATNNTNELTPADQKKLDSKKKLAQLIKQFNEEQKIQEALDKLEEEDRAEAEEVLRLETKFEKLISEAEGEKTLISELEEAKAFQLQQIRDKYAKEREDKEKKERDKLLALDKKYRQESIAAELALQQAKANARTAGLNTLRGLFGQETALGKALFAFEKASAIASIIKSTSEANAKVTASTAIANSIAVASSPLTFGQPFVSINSANAAKNLAANNINAAVNIAQIAATAIKGSYAAGGETFTGTYKGGVDGMGGQPAIVHPNEYIIPAFVRREPEVPAMIEYLEAKRTGKTSKNNNTTLGNSSNSDAVLKALASAVNDLVEKGVEASVKYTLNDERKRRELANKLDNTIKASTE